MSEVVRGFDEVLLFTVELEELMGVMECGRPPWEGGKRLLLATLEPPAMVELLSTAGSMKELVRRRSASS